MQRWRNAPDKKPESKNNELNTWMPANKYKRIKNKLKQQRINVVINESDTTLTESMEKVLSRGLKFAILPLQLDITQVLTEFKYFERTLVWKEFWFGKYADETYTEPIFKQQKKQLSKES